MSLWICLACTTPFSVGAPACPQCGATKHAEQDSPEADKAIADAEKAAAKATRPSGGEAKP